MLLDIIYNEDQANDVLFIQEENWSMQRITKDRNGSYRALFDVPRRFIEDNKYLLGKTTVGMDTIYILDIVVD